VKSYRGISDSQANAEALARRSAPYTAASDASFRIKWGGQHREVDNLGDAVRVVRRAFADEIPEKMHDGLSYLADDGTPRMNARAVGYIFGEPDSDDAGPDDLMGYHFTPVRAQLYRMAHGQPTERVYATIVAKITVGGQGPREAALAAGVLPEAIAKGVALMALRAFLRGLTDIKLHPPRIREADNAVA